jgi:hypothetical protein
VTITAQGMQESSTKMQESATEKTE